MNPLAITKGVVGLIVSMGVGTIVGNTIKASTNSADLNLLNKVGVGLGALAISGLVSSKVSQHTTDTIDNTLEQIEEVKSELRKKD